MASYHGADWYTNTGTLFEIQTQINKYRTGEYVTTPTAAQADIVAMVSGLQARLTSTANPSTVGTLMATRSDELDIEIMQASQDLEVMKERVASLRNPYENQSYYESWFPLNRPLRNISIVVLLGLGIFFYVFTLFTLMNAFGLHFRLNISWWSPENIVKFGKLMPIGGAVIIVILIVLCVIAYLRKG